MNNSLSSELRKTYILSTLPERRQRLQTETVVCVPFTLALTFLMLGFQVLLVFLLEWETLRPKVTPLPQYSHFAIYNTSALSFFTTYRLQHPNIQHFFVFVNIFLGFFQQFILFVCQQRCKLGYIACAHCQNDVAFAHLCF